MTERLIEIGGLRIHLKADEDPVMVLQSLMRHVSNQEVADMLGISERTVRRWKREGRLPRQGHARLKLADLISHLVRNGSAETAHPEDMGKNGTSGKNGTDRPRRRRRAPAGSS